MDRVAAQADALEAPRPPPRRSLLDRLVHTEAPERPHPGVPALAGGLAVLRAQLDAALAELGVAIDRGVGAPVDPERQRVVEVRTPRAGEQAGTVVEVVRAGLSIGPAVVREAEVVVAAGRTEPERIGLEGRAGVREA